MIEIKHIDFGYNELGTCKFNELRRDIATYRGEELKEIVLKNMDKLITVARVESESLEEAFMLTNSIENSWYRNQNKKVTVVQGGRSSSIGDVFLKDGVCYMVDSFGFIELGVYYEANN